MENEASGVEGAVQSNWPPKWEEFAEHSDAPNLGNTFGQTAYSFQNAAMALIETWQNTRGASLEVPIAFTFRHWVEVSIKSVWEEAASIGFEGLSPSKTHRLLHLWDPLDKFFVKIGLISKHDDCLRHFRAILRYLDVIDRSSVSFRYPLDDRKFHFRVSVPKLVEAMDVCDTMFFGLRAEIDRYAWFMSDHYATRGYLPRV